MAHSRDFSLGLPGMPDPNARQTEFPRIPFLIADTARKEYIAVRAECAVQESLFGGVVQNQDIGRQVDNLRSAIVTLTGYGDAPPMETEDWDRASARLGYALGQLAAYGDAASPLLSRDNTPTTRTTADVLARMCRPGTLEADLVLDAREALAPFHGLPAGTSTDPGYNLLAASSTLFSNAIMHGNQVYLGTKAKSELAR